MARQAILDWFWTPGFWLPGTITWDDLVSTPELRLPSAGDLWLGFYISIFLLALRFFFEKYVATPIAIAAGLPQRPRLPTPSAPHPLLEDAFTQKHRPDASTLEALSKQTDLPLRQIQIWFRQRLQAHLRNTKPQIIEKFNESCWRFIYYLSIFMYGMAVMHNKPWFWETKLCWIGWPDKIPVNETLRWYYMIQIGFYASLFISQFFDIQRKDFWQMFIHHVATLILLGFSWVINMVRIGSLVLVVHDAVDWLLEISKMTNYAKKERLCEFCFVIFAVVWVASRLVTFPLVLIWSSLFEATATLQESEDVRKSLEGGVAGVYYLFNGLLILLYCLHWFWFYHIMSMAFKLVVYGTVAKDARSETEDSEDDENDNLRTNGEVAPENGTDQKPSKERVPRKGRP